MPRLIQHTAAAVAALLIALGTLMSVATVAPTDFAKAAGIATPVLA